VSYIAENARGILLLLCNFANTQPAGDWKISGSSSTRIVVAVTYMGLEEFDANVHAFDHIEKVCLQDE
jgi:hypothetical protein